MCIYIYTHLHHTTGILTFSSHIIDPQWSMFFGQRLLEALEGLPPGAPRHRRQNPEAPDVRPCAEPSRTNGFMAVSTRPPSFQLLIHLPIYLSNYLSICLSVTSSILYIYMYVYLSLFRKTHINMHVCTYMYVYIYMYLCTYVRT